MCHDYTHCADYDKNICPADCFRAEVTKELQEDKTFHDPVSWAHFKGSPECKIKARKKCGDCRWLTGRVTSIGIECKNPELQKKWRSAGWNSTARYKPRSATACKRYFEPNGTYVYEGDESVKARYLIQFMNESRADLPMNLPERYWTKGWNEAMTAMAKKVKELAGINDEDNEKDNAD